MRWLSSNLRQGQEDQGEEEVSVLEVCTGGLRRWRMVPKVRRDQGGDRHGLTKSTLPCPGRGSDSCIKQMLQLVLNWEVSQAAVKTGMIIGALCDPKQGQTLQRERTEFLGFPRKDLTETQSGMGVIWP